MGQSPETSYWLQQVLSWQQIYDMTGTPNTPGSILSDAQQSYFDSLLLDEFDDMFPDAPDTIDRQVEQSLDGYPPGFPPDNDPNPPKGGKEGDGDGNDGNYDGADDNSGEDWSDDDGGCFSAETPVLLAGGTWSAIANLKEGDRVISYDPRSRSLNSRSVRKLFVHERKRIITLKVEGIERCILTTSAHRFFTNGHWVSVGELPVGAQLLRFDPERGFTSARLTAKERTSKVERVFNIEVDKDHNFFAGGTLVHNEKDQEEEDDP